MRISQLETQALQPKGNTAAASNIAELHAKLEHAGLQMQVRGSLPLIPINSSCPLTPGGAGLLECD